ncbi:hypothetical protein LguiA_023142 [Lonicera macranthoides]
MDASNLVLKEVNNKKSRTEKIAGEEDRLSNLHESILSRIISLLPINDAVRTSVLSTKWIHLWKTISNLHIDYYHKSDRLPKHYESLKNIVDRALAVDCPPINNFYFAVDTYGLYNDTSRIRCWITALIRRNVQKLHIFYPCYESFVLPHCLNRSDSLIELDLQLRCTFSVPPPICFSSLKVLQLLAVTFSNERFPQSREIHFSFPVLEVLSLNGCYWQKVEVANFDAPKLNSFTFVDSNNYYMTSDLVLKIHGSSPKKFKRGGYAGVDTIFTSPSSVIDATIELFHVNLEDPRRRMGLFLCTLLRQFSRLKHLALNDHTVEAFCRVEDFGGRTFIPLMHSFPHLESLTFPFGVGSANIEEEITELVVPPPCLRTRLKVVRFGVLNGIERELKLVKYLLKNAEVLEEMSITASLFLQRNTKSESEMEDLKEEVLAFPRGSNHVSILFNKWCCINPARLCLALSL